MSPELVAGLDLLAGLSEGQRPIAHLVLVVGLLAGVAAVGLVQLMRRRARPDRPPERQRVPEEE